MTETESSPAREPTRGRRVLRRKRAVVRDSVSVVRTTLRTLRRDRFLVRVLGGVVLAALACGRW